MDLKLRFDRPPIIVLGAMDCEVSLLESKLEKRETLLYRGSGRYSTGYLDGYPVAVVMSLMGMVNAAVSATLAIQTFKPKCLICQGTSGAHDPELHQGDMIIGENIIENSGHYTGVRKAGEGMSDPGEWEFHGKEMITPKGIMMIKEFHSDEKMMKIAESVKYTEGHLRRGTVSSGDLWNREIDTISYYHDALGSDCEEMEGFATAQVCSKFEVPMLLLRIISNSEYYPEEAYSDRFGEMCQKYTLDVLRKIIKENA